MKTSDITDTEVCICFAECPPGQSGCRPFQALMRKTGAPKKVALAACERAAERGLSLQTGWLTEKGKLLAALEPITRIARVCVPPGTTMTADKPVRNYIAGVWPTLHDLKELEHAMVAFFGYSE